MPPGAFSVGQVPLIDAIANRRSRRRFTDAALTLEELSFLLWATQGVTGEGPVLRAVPSAGARHPFETYLVVSRVEGVTPGLYRYLPLEHQLVFLEAYDTVAARAEAVWGERQSLWGSAVVFIWTAIPYRTAWRYERLTPKLIALDAGHVCHALYLACEGIGAGTCAIGAYRQEQVDAILGLSPAAGNEDEFAVYIAPVGKVGA